MAYHPDSRVAYLVQHYSATPIEKDFTMADIDRMHRRRGFKEIGYHFYIRKDGTIERGRDLTQAGRFEQGAHSSGENDTSIGICTEGGVRAADPNKGVDTRTPAQIASQIKVIEELLERYPDAVVKGHRDMPNASTQCPAYDATAWWEGVQAQKEAEVSQSAPVMSLLQALFSLFTQKGSK